MGELGLRLLSHLARVGLRFVQHNVEHRLLQAKMSACVLPLEVHFPLFPLAKRGLWLGSS